MSKYKEWEMRKDGFKKHLTIVTAGKNLGEAEASDQERPPDPKENLINLAVFLSEFTTKLFDFFFNGFSDFLGSNESKAIKLIPSAKYSPEFVLQKILLQASFDLTVIQRAIEQRKDPDLANFLADCDRLALSALAIAFPDPQKKETWLIEPVKPFVYFQRETSVRIIPYANALLIGVPYSAFCQPIDLLSIPHEIGHHVYETGRFSENEPINLFFAKYFADQDDWIQNWLEEIFADLYGFLVGGPIIGFSLQEILLDNLPESLWEDDGDHPAGIVRPLIYDKLFNSEEYKVTVPGAQKTAEALREKWLSEGRKRGFANRFRSATDSNFIEGNPGSVTLSTVMQKMSEEINKNTSQNFIFSTHPDQNDNLHPWTFFPDQESFPPGALPINHKEPFANFVVKDVLDSDSQKSQIDKMEKILGDPKLKFGLSRREKNAFWLTGQIKYWSGSGDLPPLVPDIWRLVFTAFSWADKPDETRPVKGPEKISPEYIR